MQGGHIVVARHVTVSSHSLATGTSDLVDGLGQTFVVDIGQYDLRPLAGERFRGGSADPTGRACHYGNPTYEIGDHDSPPRSYSAQGVGQDIFSASSKGGRQPHSLLAGGALIYSAVAERSDSSFAGTPLQASWYQHGTPVVLPGEHSEVSAL
jgi:hypothetical protein